MSSWLGFVVFLAYVITQAVGRTGTGSHDQYKAMLDEGIPWTEMERWSFYEKIKSPDTTLAIATGEQRRFANLLLTVGVVKLAEENFLKSKNSRNK